MGQYFLMNRRTFLAAAAAAQTRSAAPFELDEVSLTDLAAGLQQGRWTSRRLLDLYRARIDAVDRNGPRLGAVIELNPDAEALADQLDRETRQHHVRGPLHGIPILLKDNIDTADRMSTSAGSLALDGWHPPQDSFVAARLRAAGALIMGKTNLSEWANFRSTHSVSGWSGRGGQTRNPYALHRNPSGSSSGSGAAVAACLCAAAMGTETDGSVVSPASINGIVGVKPTLGLISRTGIIPISHSQDTAGPMARTVRDAALLLSALSGVDPAVSAITASMGTTGGKAQPDYTKFLDASGLHGARLGIARKFFDKNAPVDAFLNRCVDVLKRSGAEIVDAADLPSHGKWNDVEMEVLLYEFKADLNGYLSKLPSSRQPRSLAGLIDFNERNRAREMPYFDQEIFQQAEAKGPLTEKKYLDARKLCLQLTRTEGIDAVIDKYKLDAIVTLTSGPAWMIDWVNGDTDTGGCSSPPAIAGYPHITVPAGLFRGLPVGLSFFGKAWSEAALFRLAYAFESVTKARQKPKFLAGVEQVS
ncbi:MAG TPA: amidase [Candidatus Binataceae bacterium]|nr:amidase [Candidatus Binataceae bacterium]